MWYLPPLPCSFSSKAAPPSLQKGVSMGLGVGGEEGGEEERKPPFFLKLGAKAF